MIRDIINRLSLAGTLRVVAPITPPTEKIYTRVGGVPFVYKRSHLPNGWLRIEFGAGPGRNIADDPPAPGEIEDYLALLKPDLRLIVIYRLDTDTWLCYPYNRGDASQKGWSDGPVPVYLVNDAIEPFDIIYACGPIHGLVYWRAVGSLPEKQRLIAELGQDDIGLFGSEITEARQIARGRIENERIRQAKLEKENQLKTFEGRLKYHLEFLGADLVSWRESGRDIVVEWRDGQYNYSSRIQSGMRVTSAGICLSDRDSDFSIAALVDVMREARRLNRPGASGEMGSDDEE